VALLSDKQQLLIQQIDNLRSELAKRESDLSQLRGWMDLVERDIRANFKSWSWRIGFTIVKLLKALLLKKHPAAASYQVNKIFKNYRQWREKQLTKRPFIPASTFVPRSLDISVPSSFLSGLSVSPEAKDRLGLAYLVMQEFEQVLGPQWNLQTESFLSEYWEKIIAVGPQDEPRVMIGTMYSGENEFEASKASIGRQSYKNLEQVVISDLPNRQAHAALYERFSQSDFDLMIKLDADMVMLDPDFVKKVVAVFNANPELTLLQMSILDYYSGGTIQGINAYRNNLNWRSENQHNLFTDKVEVSQNNRMVNWTTFNRSVIHSPHPAEFQAFHFGVHRALKIMQPQQEKYDLDRAGEQIVYLERTWQHYQTRKEKNLLFACLGSELAMSGSFETSHLDYTNPHLRKEFENYEKLPQSEVESLVEKMRAKAVEHAQADRLRQARNSLATRDRVSKVLMLLPHLGVFGGVNRFFELARCFGQLGVEAVVARPDQVLYPKGFEAGLSRRDFPGVKIANFSEVIEQDWDVVLCGDFSSGIMQTMPLFKSKMNVVYLLNGWQHRIYNLNQIRATHPDVIVANSSYAARHYADLAPTIVPGGIDLDKYLRQKKGRSSEPGKFKVCLYAGQRKPRKRFEDGTIACEILKRRGIPVELHVFGDIDQELDVPFEYVSYATLDGRQVAELLNKMDLMICPEEDAGWSNPAAEAMACGLPLVCSEAGTLDFAIHEETALLVPNRQPHAIADAAERIYRDRELAEKLSQAGLVKIREFAWMTVARNLLDVFAGARLDREARERMNRVALTHYDYKPSRAANAV
jgi:glycosyl transferase family 1